MDPTLISVIDELLRYKEGSAKKTIIFKNIKHNNDLCPAVERQLRNILDSFLKYHRVVYDIQGLSDRGTDVILRIYENNDDNKRQKFLAFQIKSYGDIQSNNYLVNLRTQYFKTLSNYQDNLENYYILLCTDINKHRNKIRQIKNEFVTFNNITIIDPTYMLNFLKLNQMRINALIECILKEDDLVYEKAVKAIISNTPTEIALLLTISLEVIITGKKIIDPEIIKDNLFMKEIYNCIPDFPREHYEYDNEYFEYSNDDIQELNIDMKRSFEERFYDDLENLDTEIISINLRTGLIEVKVDLVLPIQAILLDSLVRYDYNIHSGNYNNILKYIYHSLNIPKLFNIEEYFESENLLFTE